MTLLTTSSLTSPAQAAAPAPVQAGLTTPSVGYKPFRYPWMFDAWKAQQQVHWLPEEVPMDNDKRDWAHKLNDKEKNLLSQIMRFFTQGDIEVSDCYHRHYMTVFKPTEAQMMLTSFANMETIHIAAYSLLLETLGMNDIEYTAFMHNPAMKQKSDYMKDFNVKDPLNVALTLAAFGGFTEGLQLFASFAILMNFPRRNLMKGMGQIVTWSVRDETLHCNSIIRLFHQWLAEHPEIDRAELSRQIKKICREIVEHEFAFIDTAFELGDVEGLKAQDVKNYVLVVANERLRQLGEEELYDVQNKDPLPWLNNLLFGREHANFFEARATEYQKAATRGSWDDVFA